jgi:streptogramin lyase
MTLLICLFMASITYAKTVDVLVWDRPFDRQSPLWPRESNQGQWGNSFHFLSHSPLPKPTDSNAWHGMQVSWVLMKDSPFVRLHFAGDAFLPWQDPEKCRLTEDLEFQHEALKQGHVPLPDCRADAIAGVQRLSRFIRENHVKVVNMSHGVYYDNYILHNPYLIADHFKNVEMDIIQRFLYRNFLAIGDLVENLFRENPDVLFVVAAGNNGDEVDREWFLKWSEDHPKKYPIPTLYAAYTRKYANVISVASTYDGERLAGGSNYGLSVLLAKHIGTFPVPSPDGWISFGGTSAAAAEISRAIAQKLQRDDQDWSAADLKRAVSESLTIKPAMAGQTLTGGIFDQAKFDATEPPPKIESLSVQSKSGRFQQYSIPDNINPRHYGCHSLVASPDGKIWMTMSWANLIASFDPQTGKFVSYPLPVPESEPDGITIDQSGNLWAGTHPKGGLVRLDPRTGLIQEFPHPSALTFNITAVDGAGRIWGTSHQARKLSQFDPSTNQFRDFAAGTDWPLDIRAGDDGDVWAAGLKGYLNPWGPGALIHYDLKRDRVEHFPLPPRDPVARGFWVAPAGDHVVMTGMGDGFFVLNKNLGIYRHYVRDDQKQLYNIARRHPDGRVILTNGSQPLKSLDVYDPRSPASIESFPLPYQGGEPREGLTFDSTGGAWYCQTSSNILGRLQL